MPTTIIITDEFVELGKAEANALGMPDLATLVVSHPIGGTSPIELRKKVNDGLEEMIRVLTMPRERLPESLGEK